ncbi:MAG: transglutaminase domain-containing protein, partial [Huintestinicola sp.]
DQAVKVFTIVYDSAPQLFWMGNTISAGSSFATLSFKTTDRNEIKSMQSEIESAASSILSKAKNYSGTVSKLKVFFDSIVLNGEFSKSESGYNCSIYNGLTAKGPIQCAGYAKTMQYLCDMAGIECCVVRGSDKDGNSHAWNVVYCENGYYNLDSTWGDPINSFGSSYIQYEFFLVPDAWIHNITHFNVSTLLRSSGAIKLFTPPSCTKEACNYFAAYNKLYDSKADAEAAMYAAIDEAIANGKNVAEIRVTSKSVYDTLMSDDYFKTFQKYAKSKSSSVKQIQRQRSFTGGVQVVHYDIVYN